MTEAPGVEFDQFVEFVRGLPGTAAPGLSFAHVASLFERHRADVEQVIAEQRAADAVQISRDASVVQGDEDYERWNEDRRRTWNERAVAALRAEPMSVEGLRALQNYTGFGGFRNIGVLPATYPALYVEGSTRWVEAVREGRVPSGPGTDLFRGLKDQYFTPLAVCRAMWRLHDRAMLISPRTALEPSAGSGRLIRTAPEGLLWTVLEWDPLLVEILRALYRNATVLQGRFEEWAASRGDDLYDVVIDNPPYPRREDADLQTDPAWSWAGMAHAYFTARSATKLSRLGTLVFLTPLSLLTSASYERERAELLRRCAFRGAAIFPDGTFPNVREGSFLVTVWTRRLADGVALTDREETVRRGGFMELPEAEAALCGGAWKDGSRGGKYLAGVPDYTRVEGVVLTPMQVSEAEVAAVQRQRSVGAARVATSAVMAGPDAVMHAEVKVDRAEALDLRVSSWLALVNTDPDKAEQIREVIRHAVVQFLSDVGNPHTLRPKRAGLRAVTTKDGSITSVLTEPVRKVAASTRPPPGSSPAEVVRWFCDRRGVATESDLELTMPDVAPEELVPALLAEGDIFVEVQPSGLWYYTRETYLFGDLYMRLETLNRALETSGVDATIGRRLTEQKEILLDTIQPRVLAEIFVTPRSGFVPVECLREWVYDHTWRENVEKIRATAAQSKPEYDHYQGPLGNQEYADEYEAERAVTAAIEFGRLKIGIGRWDGLDKASQEWVTFLLAYWNRETESVDPNEVAAKRSDAYQGDMRTRLKQEELLEASFKDWLAEHATWGPAVEDAYNRAYRSHTGVEVAGDPVAVDGFNNGITLRYHQNQAVRRVTLGGKARSMLCAYDVGAGKTLVGLVAAEKWRQANAARRPLIVVPTTVLAKWEADAFWAFPKARIGVIGITDGASDNAETRREKWLKLGSGAYDLCICSHDNFLDDVAPDDDEAREHLGKLFWVIRGLGKSFEERRLLLRRVKAAEDKIAEIQNEINENDEYERRHGTRPRAKKNQRPPEIRIAELHENTVKWRADADALQDPTDSEVETVRRHLENFLAARPFRPSDRRSTDRGDIFDVPNEGLVKWAALGIDALIVDEAHAYKNLWFPQARLGAPKIEYAGSQTQSGTEWAITKSAWDMYLKCMSLLAARGGDGGVLFLTATPVMNSPMELYSMLSYLSARVWEDRQIMHKEEFVDRYWKLEPRSVPDTQGDVHEVLAVTRFKNGDELNATLSSYMDRRTIKHLIDAGIFQQDEIPVPVQIQEPDPVTKKAGLERDPAQQMAQKVCVAYRMALRLAMKGGDSAELVKADPPMIPVFNDDGTFTGEQRQITIPDNRKSISASLLLLQDMMEKIATDPRLLAGDVTEVGKKHAHAVEINAEWEAFREGVRPSKPKSLPVDSRKLDTMNLRLEILSCLGLPYIERYYERVKYPPKIRAVAERIRKSKGGCSHIIFLKYLDLHPLLIAALVDIAGVDRSRIAQIISGVDKSERYRISKAFNGQDEVAKVVNGKRIITQKGAEPEYDIVIGTDAMSEGIDLQRRTCSIHHLTLPWEPATVQQRNGRGIRQGAQETEIEIIYYVTRKTFDGLQFGKVVGKQAWQETLFSGVKEMANPAVGMELDPIEADWYLSIEDDAEVEALIAAHRASKAHEMDERLRASATEDMVRLNSYFARVRAARDEATRESLWKLAMKRLDEHVTAYAAVTPEAVYSRITEMPVAFDATTGQYLSVGDYARIPNVGVVKILDVYTGARGYSLYFRLGSSPTEDFASTKGATRAEPGEWKDEPEAAKDGVFWQHNFGRDLRGRAGDLWRVMLTKAAASYDNRQWATPWWSHLDVALGRSQTGARVEAPLVERATGRVTVLVLPDAWHKSYSNPPGGGPAFRALAERYEPLMDGAAWSAAVQNNAVSVLELRNPPGLDRLRARAAETVAPVELIPLTFTSLSPSKGQQGTVAQAIQRYFFPSRRRIAQ